MNLITATVASTGLALIVAMAWAPTDRGPRTVYMPSISQPTCISQTMEVIPCPTESSR